MLNKLLAAIALVAVVSCSEPSAPEAVSSAQIPETAEPTARILTLWVAAEKRECMAVGPTECLQIRFHPHEDWQLFYGDIVGFEYQPGKIYQLEVSEVQIAEPAMDAPDRQWVLRQIIDSSDRKTGVSEPLNSAS